MRHVRRILILSDISILLKIFHQNRQYPFNETFDVSCCLNKIHFDLSCYVCLAIVFRLSQNFLLSLFKPHWLALIFFLISFEAWSIINAPVYLDIVPYTNLSIVVLCHQQSQQDYYVWQYTSDEALILGVTSRSTELSQADHVIISFKEYFRWNHLSTAAVHREQSIIWRATEERQLVEDLQTDEGQEIYEECLDIGLGGQRPT